MSDPKPRTATPVARLALVVTALAAGSALAQPPDTAPAAGAPPARPPVEDLGDGRARIGSLILDREAATFSLPARVVRLAPPLEFLIVGPPAERAYETLLQTDVPPVAFNFACILIGLEAPEGEAPGFHFDPDEVDGPAVRLEVSWKTPQGEVRRPAADLLAEDRRPVVADDWSYVGSTFAPDGRFLAAMDGTLVGFVHAPESIIEHRYGLGVGRYGAVSANPRVAPPVGTPVMLHVSRVEDGASAASTETKPTAAKGADAASARVPPRPAPAP